MPEGYTHARMALAAAKAAGRQITSLPAFLAGANGPDMLYCYQGWKSGKKRDIDLPALGNRLHAERTGAFLRALADLADTPAKQDYFLGFVCHYAVDTVMHPYVVAVTRAPGPYQGPAGHGYFESALDSWLHRQDTGSGAVPVKDISPAFAQAELTQVTGQLQAALARVYGLEIPRQKLETAFRHNNLLRGLFCSHTPLRLRRWLCYGAERVIGGPGYITGHLTPAALRRQALPCPWQHPFTGRAHTEDLDALLALAQANADRLLAAALAPNAAFWAALGSRDYVTGTETAHSMG